MQPTTKKSKAKKGHRRSHHALRAVHLMACPQCGQARLPHAACSNCGYVNAHTTLKPETTEES